MSEDEEWTFPAPKSDVFYVYKFYDDTDALIYVGTSKNGFRRLHNHHLDKWWFSEVMTVRLERYATDDESLDREAALAVAYEPRHNDINQFLSRNRFVAAAPDDSACADPALLTLGEARQRIGVSVSTLREQAQKGRLKATLVGKTWMVLASEVDRYAREHKGHVGRPRKVSTDE